jgi:hypothetical protein
VLVVIPVLIAFNELGVVVGVAALISVPNPVDAMCFVCSAPVEKCDVDCVDVDVSFVSVLVGIPVLASFIELAVMF